METIVTDDPIGKLELQNRIRELERELSECRTAERFCKNELYKAERKIIELDEEIKKLTFNKEET